LRAKKTHLFLHGSLLVFISFTNEETRKFLSLIARDINKNILAVE
jgi:hypothetical protein